MLFTVSCTILLVPQASSFVQSVCLHVCTSRTTYKCARECVAGVGKEPAPPPSRGSPACKDIVPGSRLVKFLSGPGTQAC